MENKPIFISVDSNNIKIMNLEGDLNPNIISEKEGKIIELKKDFR